MLLIEGNASSTVLADTFHGTNHLTTIFRNRLTGSGVTAIDIWANDRFHNILGNVLGTAGSSALYESSNPSSPSSGWNTNIYRFGFPYIDAVTSYGRCSGGNMNFDALVPNSTFRWGNYDTVTNAVRFVSTEVPTGLSQYANAMPAGQVLPDSFYLSAAKPNWWPATKPYPAVGPDVTGGNVAGVTGHAYTIPALDCFSSIGGNMATFNAATCYAQAGPQPPAPAPPTSLTLIVH
jgi:hypothetical protein